MNTAIILGSSRSQGNTHQLASYVSREMTADYFDLARFHIAPFNYDNNYQDDFLYLISKLLTYKQLIFASPIYWYSASAQMKVFLDRLTDLLEFYPTQGQILKGKYVGLLATGLKAKPPACFEQMFKLTFDYLEMKYMGMGYCSVQEIQLNLINQELTTQSLIGVMKRCKK